MVGYATKIRPCVVIEKVALDICQDAPGRIDGHRIIVEAKNVFNQEGQGGRMVTVGVSDNHMANPSLLVDFERPRDGSSINGHSVIDEKGRHSTGRIVATKTTKDLEFHRSSIPCKRDRLTRNFNHRVGSFRIGTFVTEGLMGKSGKISRLGLLMAGGGAKIRRIVAGADDRGGDLADLLEGRVPSAVLDAARMTEESAVPQLLERVSLAGWRWIGSETPDYPLSLNHTADPPLGLFVKGYLGGGPSVAIVGSRRATPYGIQVSRLLAENVGRAGGTIISGMARGVDAAAHEGALSAGGRTWAVWGCGPDRIYPPEHAQLAEQIAETGALLTEYPPGSPPRRHHFPERNRIIAGLASIVVVVEAAARSGALSTARQALDEGRDVMAVPGSIFSEVSVGPNGLLRAGAQPVTCPGDLLEALDLEAGSRVNHDPEESFLKLGEAVSVDQLAERMGQTVDLVQARIVEMEIQGLVERGPDGLIRRRR